MFYFHTFYSPQLRPSKGKGEIISLIFMSDERDIYHQFFFRYKITIILCIIYYYLTITKSQGLLFWGKTNAKIGLKNSVYALDCFCIIFVAYWKPRYSFLLKRFENILYSHCLFWIIFLILFLKCYVLLFVHLFLVFLCI